MSAKNGRDPSQSDAPLPALPDPSVRARLLAALRGAERFTPFAPDVARVFGLTSEDALAALRRIDDPSAWQQGLWPGSQLLRTEALGAASAIIARLPPGMRIGEHRHSLRELTYILDGALVETGCDRVFESGQLVDRAGGTAHEVEVVGAGHCLVVFALWTA